MPRLVEIADLVSGELLNTDGHETILGVSYDSRRVREGDVFVAISGFKEDGAKYAQDAYSRGAIAVACEPRLSETLDRPAIVVMNPRAALATMAWELAGNPQHNLKLVGVTGTNGKTTVTAALSQLLGLCGRPTGVCGTLGMYFEDTILSSERTTAEAPELANALSVMQKKGAEYVTLEATSIGLALHRLDELKFDVGVFTNLSRDHLDFHGTWEEYRRAKLLLFDSNRLTGTAVINSDDPESIHFLNHTKQPSLTYGLDSVADFQATDINLNSSGTDFVLNTPEGRFEVSTSFIGRFNVYNTLSIIASAWVLGVSLAEAIEALPSVKPVRGRAEVINSMAPFTVIVDYAHSPDALEKILSTVRTLASGRLHCVIGAGGDRDKGKRPLMARAVEAWSDRIYLTSDNPRTEAPESILADMRSGITNASDLYLNIDRRKAIFHALNSTRSGDVLVVAGKGHETYQEVNGVKGPFDDAEVVRDWFRQHGYLK